MKIRRREVERDSAGQTPRRCHIAQAEGLAFLLFALRRRRDGL